MAGGFVVAVALSADQRRRGRHEPTTTTTPERDGDDANAYTSLSRLLFSFLRTATSATATAASAASKTKTTLSTPPQPPPLMPDILSSIGNTPMMRVVSLSEATGCDILIKCEFANPGGRREVRAHAHTRTPPPTFNSLSKPQLAT